MIRWFLYEPAVKVDDSSDPKPQEIKYYKQERMGRGDKCTPSGMTSFLCMPKLAVLIRPHTLPPFTSSQDPSRC
jgi:hypothetical protein